MKLTLYWNYATRSLARGGQRTLLAIFSIAVGVMAVVALQLVGLSINGALTGNIVSVNGGDLRTDTRIQPLTQQDLTYFDQLKSQGKISEYATANSYEANLTLPDGSVENFTMLAVSSNYPIAGNADFTNPSGTTIQNVVKGTTVAIESRLNTDIKGSIGSTFQAALTDGRVVSFTIGGIYKDGGGYTTKEIIISQDTLNAVLLNGKTVPPSYSTVYANVRGGNAANVKTLISDHFPSATVTTVQDQLQQQQANVSNIRLFLQIVGLVALFIGGIGIINTMQVLLRRRQLEIAMLKTNGYRQGDLYSMFGLEAALLGLTGGIFGTGLGVGASIIVRQVMHSLFFISLPTIYDPLTIASGVAIGLATAAIFGILPIVQASQVRPLAVLRDMSESTPSSILLTISLLALLSVLFVGLASTILGNLVTAIIVVYGGALLIGALAIGFGLLVMAISKLPVYESPTFKILIWIGIAVGALIASAILAAILSAIGGGAVYLANKLGNSVIGTYVLVVLGGLGLVLISSSVVFFLATLLDTIVMFLPRSWKTAVMFAFRNIGRTRARTTATVTALFVGVFAIGLIVVLGQGIKDSINSILANTFTRNTFVIVPPFEQAKAKQVLDTAPGVSKDKTISNLVTANLIPQSVAGTDFNTLLKEAKPKVFRDQTQIGQIGLIISLSSMQGYNVASGSTNDLPPNDVGVITSGRDLTAIDAGTNNVVVPNYLNLPPANMKVGDTIILKSRTGATIALNVVGFWNGQSTSTATSFAEIWSDVSAVQKIGDGQSIVVFSAKVNPDNVNALRKTLSKEAPGAQLLSIADITNLVSQVLNNIIVMLSTIASLAMIAGLVIIANAVALGMLERRREIGILKSVGHTSGSILSTVLIENGTIGLMGSLVAMTLVGGAITLLSTLVFKTSIVVGLSLVGIIILATTTITLIIAATIAWSATRVRPLEVLRYE